jgi:cell fate (sporulation/competence/biofilm development) regulator YmcA (YheA/YmcA/DUF963 family)
MEKQMEEKQYIRKEYTVIVKLGTEIVNVSAYDEINAMRTAHEAIIEAYGSDLAEEADYLIREVRA